MLCFSLTFNTNHKWRQEEILFKMSEYQKYEHYRKKMKTDNSTALKTKTKNCLCKGYSIQFLADLWD